MATFKFGRQVNIHWNGFEVVGPAETVFSIPDQLYEEFEGDFRHVEPSLVWLDTNEFQTLKDSVPTGTYVKAAIGQSPISVSTSSSTATISLNSGTALNGYLLVADGTGGTIWNPASTSGINSVVGVSPISSTISGGTVSVSLTANYQTAGTYVNAVIGTSPASVVTASGTSTVSIDQAAITGATSANNAQVVRFYVKNTTGSTIDAGKAVYVSGATGDNALISLASATADPTSSKTLGLTLTSIANDAFGYVVEAGYITGIDTTGVSAGSSVWLGNTPGSLVYNTPPAEPSHAVYLGVVIREQQNNGSILVKVQNGYELNELHDVFTTGVSTALPLVYSSTSSGWVAQALDSVGIADNAVVESKINAAAVSSAKIADNAIITSKILDAAVTSAKIGAGAINSTHIGANAVVAGDIAANAVTSGNIAAGAVGSSQLADNAVVAAKIASASVGTAALSSGTATSGSVLTANGSGGVSFTALSSAATGFYVNGSGSVSGSSITSAQNGPYLLTNVNSRYIRVNQSTSSDTVQAQATIFINQKSSMTASLPIGWTWTSIDVGTTTAQANNIKYKNSAFYVLYNNGNISRSTDGSTFTVQISAATQALNDVEFGGSTLVACGNSGLIISSSNGTSWTQRTSNASTDNLGGVAYGASTFAVVGNAGRLVTSSDGTTWTARTSGFGTTNIVDVLFGASLFVAYSINGIRTSPDGITWTVRTVPATIAGNLNRGTFENSLFVIGSNAGEIITSSDGITWTEVTSPNGSSVRGIEYLGSSRWIMTGQNGTVYYSFDNASTWETLLTINNAQQAISALDDMSLSFGNNRLFAVNGSNSNPASVYSTTTEPFSFAFIGMTSVTA